MKNNKKIFRITKTFVLMGLGLLILLFTAQKWTFAENTPKKAADEDVFVDREGTNRSENLSMPIEPKRQTTMKSGIASMEQNGTKSDEFPQNSILFQKTSLTDPVSGITVFDSIIPSGWKTSCNVNWHNISLDTPGIATLMIAAPDDRAAMSYISKQDFIDNVAIPFVPHQDGVDLGSYTTKLRYKRADALADWICRNLLKAVSVKLIENKPVKEDLRSLVNSTAQTYAKTISEKLGSLLANVNSSLTVNGFEGSVADHRFEVVGQDGKTYWIELLCASIGCDTTIVNRNIIGNLGTMRTIQWYCPVIFLYSTESQVEFNRWNSAFDMFVQNTVLRPEFHILNRKYANEIQNNYFKMKTRQLAEMNRISAERMMNDRSTDSSGSPSLDITEKWSDAILDLNTFQTNDGGKIKASTSLDHVFQNGDNFLGMEGHADPPAGWNELKLMQ